MNIHCTQWGMIERGLSCQITCKLSTSYRTQGFKCGYGIHSCKTGCSIPPPQGFVYSYTKNTTFMNFKILLGGVNIVYIVLKDFKLFLQSMNSNNSMQASSVQIQTKLNILLRTLLKKLKIGWQHCFEYTSHPV